MGLAVVDVDPVDQAERLMGRWLDAWNTRDPEAFSWLVTSDVVFEDPMSGSEPICGRAEYFRYLKAVFTAFPNLEVRQVGPVHFSLDGHSLAVGYRMTGDFTGELLYWRNRFHAHPRGWAPTGRRLETGGVSMFQLRHGLINRGLGVVNMLDSAVRQGLVQAEGPGLPCSVRQTLDRVVSQFG
ncbi:hypothetical protein D5S17_17065 [Pseudonocardiaceae bacterium YIM PH 21723]|nr:hypothetical protein D5S17_17065 [Pseudonocardiaceae bacterium YIM PH 21723]